MILRSFRQTHSDQRLCDVSVAAVEGVDFVFSTHVNWLEQTQRHKRCSCMIEVCVSAEMHNQYTECYIHIMAATLQTTCIENSFCSCMWRHFLSKMNNKLIYNGNNSALQPPSSSVETQLVWTCDSSHEFGDVCCHAHATLPLYCLISE